MNASRILSTAANVAVIGGLAILLMGPSGMVSTRWQGWRKAARAREHIAQEWNSLTQAGARLDQDSVAPSLVVYSDYQCRFCRDVHNTIESWLSENEAGIVLRHLPLSTIHPVAEGAARAAICAEEQDRFHEVNRQLFQHDAWQDDEDWIREATLAGVSDLEQFAECLYSSRASERLRQDVLLAERLGIRGTPTIVHQGGKINGSISAETQSQISATP